MIKVIKFLLKVNIINILIPFIVTFLLNLKGIKLNRKNKTKVFDKKLIIF